MNEPSPLSAVKNFANPAYHWRKIKEDFNAAKSGISVWHLGTLRSNAEAFANAARGKFFATFVLAGFCAALALPLGHSVQVAAKNYYAGMAAVIIIGHGLANIAFQIIWAWSNSDLYKSHRGVQKFLAIQRDLLPMQWKGLKIATVLTLIALPIVALITWLFQRFLPNLVEIVPMGALMALIDIMLFNSHFVRLMGNLYEQYSHTLAKKYCVSADTASTVSPIG